MTAWLKLQGSSTPRAAWVPNDWWGHHLTGDETVQFESGPARGRCPIRLGDSVILAASGWSRVFAAVEIVRGPERAAEPRWGPKWPWVLYGELIAFVDRIEHGPSIVEAGLPRSYGSSYQRITNRQFEAGVRALRAAREA